MKKYAAWRSLFAEAMDETFYTLEHLDSLIASGQAKFWGGEEAAIITDIRTYPGGAKVIHGLIAAGKMPEIVNSLIPKAEAWAKEIGCTHAVIESRYGWQKVLEPYGYAPFQLAVRKEL